MQGNTAQVKNIFSLDRCEGTRSLDASDGFYTRRMVYGAGICPQSTASQCMIPNLESSDILRCFSDRIEAGHANTMAEMNSSTADDGADNVRN